MIRRAFVAPPGQRADVGRLQPARPLRARAPDEGSRRLSSRCARAPTCTGSPRPPSSTSPPRTITLEERQLGKVVNFATFAGQGPSALALQLGVGRRGQGVPRALRSPLRAGARVPRRAAPARERARLHRDDRGAPLADRRARVARLARSLVRRAPRTPRHARGLGRRRLAPRAARRRSRAARGRPAAVPLVQVLDEVLFEVPESELTEAARVRARRCGTRSTLEVPLVVGVEAGQNWADLEPA